MTRTAALADHLDDRTEAILAVWKGAIERRADVPDAKGLTYAEFVDHIPQLLDRIAQRLRGGQAKPDHEAKQHGSVRWKQGYDIAELVTELGCLRSALLQATFAHFRDSGDGRETIEAATSAINEVLDEATAESVGQFQGDSQVESGRLLAEMERRTAAINLERKKLRTVLETLPVGVWVVDREGGVMLVNRDGERLQGFALADALGAEARGRGDDEPEPSRVHAPGELPVERALRGETVSQEEIRWPLGDVTRWVTANAVPLANVDGSIAGAVVVAQDVTERQLLKAELARSESRFRTIAEQSPVMIRRLDVHGRCDYVNRSWLDFRGRSPHQEAGDGWVDGLHPEDRPALLDRIRESVARRAAFEATYRMLRRDGEFRALLDRGAPYFDERERFLGYLVSCIDITERVELESALEKQSEHKTRLISTLSHDARTPLNAVVLAAELLESQVKDQDDPDVQESLRVIRNSVRNVLDLLSDLLDLTRLDAGAAPLEITRFSLGPTLAEILSSIEPQARAKGIEVRFDPNHADRVHLATDRNKLKQILTNLLSNALRYTPSGHIRFFFERTPDLIQISVEDTGIGIDVADQDRVFDEFATVARSRHSESTGLGLAICRRLSSLLGGDIKLHSRVGLGSTFTLVLPAALIVDDVPDAAAAPIPVTPATGPILIAEDHETSRRALSRVLQRMGFRVLEAGDGREAVEHARAEHPMLILMDVNMPGMDGIEATRALRADPETRDVPIFALTGDVTIVNRRRIGEAGVDGYLEKPVTWEQIQLALSRVRDRLPG